jgi:tetratricopeptide (TPR) repeat protein
MWRLSFLILAMMAGPAVADLAGDVQRKLDAAAAVQPDSREAALERVLLLHEAEALVGAALAAGPPIPENAPLVSPEAMAERAALRDAAAKDFAPFCEGLEPGECLLGEAEALLAEAPEVDRDAEREGAIGPSEARRKMAVLLARGDKFDDALEIAKAIAEPDTRNRAVRDIIELLARDRQFERAIDTVRDLDQITRMSQAVNEIIGTLISAGEREVASELLPRAIKFATAITDEGRQGEALASIGFMHFDLDEIDEAAALTERIEDDFWRDALGRGVALGFAMRGDFASGERQAERVQDSEYRAEAFRSVAAELAKVGELSAARRVVGRLENLSDRALAHLFVAVALVETNPEGAADLFAEAEALALAIEDADQRVATLATVATALIKAGNDAAAADLTRELPTMGADPRRLSFAFKSIADVYQGLGQEERALRYALEAADAMLEIGELEDRWEVLDLVRLLISLGAFEEAEPLAIRINDPTYRVLALRDLALEIVQSGVDLTGRKDDVRRIVALIRGIEGAEERDLGLLRVAAALAEAGDVAEAKAVAAGVVEPVPGNEAIVDRVMSLAEAGQLVEALRIAGRVEDPAWRAVALAAVAARL